MTYTETPQPEAAHKTAPRKRARRCNADYRWTMPKVSAFLEELCHCGSVAEAARSVGTGRQSAYRLRARLAETQYATAFDNTRREGLRARVAEIRARNRSRWDGETLSAFLRSEALERRRSAIQGTAQAVSQGDEAPAQGDASTHQGDTDRHQATGFGAKRHLPSGQWNRCNTSPPSRRDPHCPTWRPGHEKPAPDRSGTGQGTGG